MIHTITPSDEINIAIAKWSEGLLGQMDLEESIKVAVANGDLSPQTSTLVIMYVAATTYRCWDRVTEITAQDMAAEGFLPDPIDWDAVQQWH